MQLGFHTIHFSPMFGGSAPLLDIVRLTAEAGFDAIGLDQASVEDHGAVDDVAMAIADAGLRCSDVLVLLPGSDDNLLASAERLGALAAAVGAPTCIAAVPTPVPEAELVASLEACASILSSYGCRLALEFTPYSAVTSLAGARALCEAVGWDRCGLVLDALHLARSGTSVDQLAGLGAGETAAVQWDDAPATEPVSLVEESRFGRLLPGEGGLPLRSLAAAIRATGWDGIVTAEVLSDQVRRSDPAVAIREIHASMTGEHAGWT